MLVEDDVAVELRRTITLMMIGSCSNLFSRCQIMRRRGAKWISWSKHARAAKSCGVTASFASSLPAHNQRLDTRF